MTMDRIFWTICFPCGLAATLLAFWIFARMKRVGYERRLFCVRSDLNLYRSYWHIAPEKHWSRAPIIGMGVLVVIAIAALVFGFLFAGNV